MTREPDLQKQTAEYLICPQCAKRVEEWLWLYQGKYYCTETCVKVVARSGSSA